MLPKKVCGNNCCVVECNSRGYLIPGISYYRFPSKPWEKDRRKQWISAVRRNGIDGKPWEPSKNTTICSLHFQGGAKSEDPRKNAYNPTIFPDVYKRNQAGNSGRAERLAKRKEKLENSLESTFETGIDTSNESQCDNSITGNALREMITIGIQTDDQVVDPQTEFGDESSATILFVWNDETTCEASTQTCIPLPKKRDLCNKIIVPSIRASKTVQIGPDEPARPGFVGFADISKDSDMKQLGGINLSVFSILLAFISPKKKNQPQFYRTLGAENRLLLFLMKMKMGLTFGTIGLLFHVSGRTASNIFYSILDSLFDNIHTWVFWPSKAAIKRTMPKSFHNYPNCRAIIDCTELRTDTPPDSDQRVLMYSSYKSGFTVKFLIGISPSGMITFVSKGYGGRATDGYIVNDSGFLDLVEPGDDVMADKGFPQIKSELLKRECVLVMPPFAFDPQFTKEEVMEGYSIASVRIHVERAIQRIKIFRILSHIPIDLLPKIDKIMHVACCLANTKEPLIRSESE